MVAYIQKLAEVLIDSLRFPLRPPSRLQDVAGRLAVLAEEMNRLDPREFQVAAQFDFVEARRQVRSLARSPLDHWERSGRALRDAAEDQRTEDVARFNAVFGEAVVVCEEVVRLLEAHNDSTGGVVLRPFAFVRDSELQKSIERDYRELVQVLLPGCAWKSAVVMAGSILEAVLHDQLTADPARRAKAGAMKGGGEDWTVADLIRVAADLGLLSAARAEAIDPVVRDYRKLIYSRQEARSSQHCTEAEALLARGALDAVCNQLS